MKTKMIISTACLVFSLSAYGQQAPALQLPKPKRFIEKLEFVLGTGLCFNYGNMFIENYRGEFANGNFVTNTRLTKAAFSVGVGVYHPVNDRVDVNIRIMWERKGYKSELNNPLNPVNNDARNYITSDYDYDYWTSPITAKLYLGAKRKFALSFGGYISLIRGTTAQQDFYNTQDNTTSSSSFKGRSLVAFSDNGGINTVAFIPGLQGFAEYDYGAIIGLSYELTFGKQSGLLFQLVDNFGLANVNKKNFTSIPSPYERNHTVSFLLGYTYQLKEKH